MSTLKRLYDRPSTRLPFAHKIGDHLHKILPKIVGLKGGRISRTAPNVRDGEDVTAQENILAYLEISTRV